MICYRDRTFCPFFTECKNRETCDRALTNKVRKDATKWWGSEDAPICQYTTHPECFVKLEGK